MGCPGGGCGGTAANGAASLTDVAGSSDAPTPEPMQAVPTPPGPDVVPVPKPHDDVPRMPGVKLPASNAKLPAWVPK